MKTDRNPSLETIMLSFYTEAVYQSRLTYVTNNGEICWDKHTKEFVVFDETYSREVGRFHSPMLALVAFESYGVELEEGYE